MSGLTPSRSPSSTLVRSIPERHRGFPCLRKENGGDKSTVTEAGYLPERREPTELMDNREGKL
eukprot:6492161-Heterocapsa_arctica.AAC.3